MHAPDDTRSRAVERLEEARDKHDARSDQYDAAAGSTAELPAFTDLKAAEDQLAAREAWLTWIDRDY
jgi:hypothetical protein